MAGKSKVYKFKRITFWAENGVVMVHDGRDGETHEVPALEFLKRGASFEMESAVEKYFDDANTLMDGACCVKACVDQALRQGDPTNERVSREKANLGSARMWSVGAGGKSAVASPRAGAKLYTGELPQLYRMNNSGVGDRPPRKLILPAGVS